MVSPLVAQAALEGLKKPTELGKGIGIGAQGVGTGLSTAYTGAGTGVSTAAVGIGHAAHDWKTGNAIEIDAQSRMEHAKGDADATRITATGSASAEELKAKTEFLKALPEHDRISFLANNPDFLKPASAQPSQPELGSMLTAGSLVGALPAVAVARAWSERTKRDANTTPTLAV